MKTIHYHRKLLDAIGQFNIWLGVEPKTEIEVVKHWRRDWLMHYKPIKTQLVFNIKALEGIPLSSSLPIVLYQYYSFLVRMFPREFQRGCFKKCSVKKVQIEAGVTTARFLRSYKSIDFHDFLLALRIGHMLFGNKENYTFLCFVGAVISIYYTLATKRPQVFVPSSIDYLADKNCRMEILSIGDCRIGNIRIQKHRIECMLNAFQNPLQIEEEKYLKFITDFAELAIEQIVQSTRTEFRI